jgi:hypothetical protein
LLNVTFTDHIKSLVESDLVYLSDNVARIEVHLSDASTGKAGQDRRQIQEPILCIILCAAQRCGSTNIVEDMLNTRGLSLESEVTLTVMQVGHFVRCLQLWGRNGQNGGAYSHLRLIYITFRAQETELLGVATALFRYKFWPLDTVQAAEITSIVPKRATRRALIESRMHTKKLKR